MRYVLALCLLVGCGAGQKPQIRLTEQCNVQPAGDYEDVTEVWTRNASFRDAYQETASVNVTFHSPDWRVARAARDADNRKLEGEQRNAFMQQACADAAGDLEFMVLLVTWDRNENDLDRGARSVWTVRLLDERGTEIPYREIIKDRRPFQAVRADYPKYGNFAKAYVVRFPRPAAEEPQILGPNVKKLRVVLSQPRGTLEATWEP